jgi:hypothetical protein
MIEAAFLEQGAWLTAPRMERENRGTKKNEESFLKDFIVSVAVVSQLL